MGACGNDSSSAFLCCLPLNVGCLVFTILWVVVFLLDIVLWYIVRFDDNWGYQIILGHQFDISDWRDWVAIIGISIYGFYIIALVICWAISIVKPVKVLSRIIIPGIFFGLINAIWYWISCGINFNNSNIHDDPELNWFIAMTIVYSIMILSWWFQMTTIKSLLAIHKMGGSGWNLKNASAYKDSREKKAEQKRQRMDVGQYQQKKTAQPEFQQHYIPQNNPQYIQQHCRQPPNPQVVRQPNPQVVVVQHHFK